MLLLVKKGNFNVIKMHGTMIKNASHLFMSHLNRGIVVHMLKTQVESNVTYIWAVCHYSTGLASGRIGFIRLRL